MISVLHSGRERWIRMQTHCRSDPVWTQIASIASIKKRESSVPLAKVARHMSLCPLKYLTMSSESCGLAQAFLGRGNRRKEQTISAGGSPMDTITVAYQSNSGQNNFPHPQVEGDWQAPSMALHCSSRLSYQGILGTRGILFSQGGRVVSPVGIS